jgi:hypothetical protein
MVDTRRRCSLRIAGNVVAVKFGWWYGVQMALTSPSLVMLNTWFAFHTHRVARQRQFDRRVPVLGITPDLQESPCLN